MGKGQSKPHDNVAAQPAEALNSQLLNAGDLKAGALRIASMGSSSANPMDFVIAFDKVARVYGYLGETEQFKYLRECQAGQLTEEQLIKIFDADGDGRITPKDFEIMFSKSLDCIEKNEEKINSYLPVIGQSAFGIGAGYALGRMAKSVYAYKTPIVLTGACVYSGVQYLAQQQYVNKDLVEAAFKKRLFEIGDVNGDGVIDRKDIEALLDERMQIVNTKLGPGGFAPGMAGYLTFAAGLTKGLGVI